MCIYMYVHLSCVDCLRELRGLAVFLLRFEEEQRPILFVSWPHLPHHPPSPPSFFRVLHSSLSHALSDSLFCSSLSQLLLRRPNLHAGDSKNRSLFLDVRQRGRKQARKRLTPAWTRTTGGSKKGVFLLWLFALVSFLSQIVSYPRAGRRS